MDDNEVCPLCCEELDISDQQFFPCKCGYQVCMWCWHRIKESESGLCPACRTPYGDDPHEFSAVDMKEVVKANKEKAAAEKREKERLRQQQAAAAVAVGGGMPGFTTGGSGVPGVGGMHIGGGSDGDLALAMAGGTRGQLDPPKDRNQLANMRVIRRNLVYAVGLPPSVATEDILRKPDYFGQYGKHSKIVLNRNHNGNGDPRRASASAYVTFVHKEDTLACILALDGFYVDGRNIRASYGTSKYCSAFIKNVRCNNPDCTYLHVMGDAEDTFTKQEIQAGYVTSGRDVLARQQDLAASGSGPNTRRRVGGGGPSSTGKVSSNPVFPLPTFCEPIKAPQTALIPPPSTSSTTQFPPVGVLSIARASSNTGFSSSIAGTLNGPSAASITAGKISRSNTISLPTSTSGTILSGHSTLVPVESPSYHKPETPAEILSRQQEQLRKMHPQNKSKANSSLLPSGTTLLVGQKKRSGSLISQPSLSHTTPLPSALPPATAASVVAGVHSRPSTQPAAHTTFTSLTPLKKKEISSSIIGNSKTVTSLNDANIESVHLPSNMPIPKGLSATEQLVFMEQRKEAMATMARQQRENMQIKLALRNTSNSFGSGTNQTNTTHSSPSSSISSSSGPVIPPMKCSHLGNDICNVGPSSIGGSVLGVAPLSGAIGSKASLTPSQSLPGSLGNIGAVDNARNRTFDLGSIGGNEIAAGFGRQPIGRFTSTKEAIGTKQTYSQSSSLPLMKEEQRSLFQNTDESSRGLQGIHGAGIWGNESFSKSQSSIPMTATNAIGIGMTLNGSNGGSGIIGGGRNHDVPSSNVSSSQGTSLLGNNSFEDNKKSGSSALASMLGIELPTGTGTLRDSLWESSTPVTASISTLKNNTPNPAPIGSGMRGSSDLIIGGGTNFNSSSGHIPIGGYGLSMIGGNIGNNNNDDVRLLERLLPGVHITSSNAQQPSAPNTNNFGGGGSWSTDSVISSQNHHQHPYAPVGVGGLNMQQHGKEQHDTWGNDRGKQQQHQQPQQPSIW